MATYRNIQEYRRRKRLKRLGRNLLIALVIVGALFGVLYAFDVFRGSPLDRYLAGQREESADQFPLTIKKEQMMDMASAGENLAILTKSSIMLYNTGGERIQLQAHGYTNPVMKTNSGLILTYDRGGKGLRLDSSSGQVGSVTTDTPILTAEISSDGLVAVATSYRAGVYNILIYDETLNLLFRKMTTDDYLSLGFSGSQSQVVVETLVSPTGLLGAELSVIDYTKEESVETILVEDILPLKVGYLGDRIAVVGQNALVQIDVSSGEQNRLDYQGALKKLLFDSDETLLTVNEDPFSTYCTITAYQKNGQTASVRLEDSVLDICCDGNTVGILVADAVLRYDLALQKLEELPLAQSAQHMVMLSDAVYLMGEETVEKYTWD